MNDPFLHRSLSGHDRCRLVGVEDHRLLACAHLGDEELIGLIILAELEDAGGRHWRAAESAKPLLASVQTSEIAEVVVFTSFISFVIIMVVVGITMRRPQKVAPQVVAQRLAARVVRLLVEGNQRPRQPNDLLNFAAFEGKKEGANAGALFVFPLSPLIFSRSGRGPGLTGCSFSPDQNVTTTLSDSGFCACS